MSRCPPVSPGRTVTAGRHGVMLRLAVAPQELWHCSSTAALYWQLLGVGCKARRPRVREGVFSSTCCRCSAILHRVGPTCVSARRRYDTRTLHVRCHECCRVVSNWVVSGDAKPDALAFPTVSSSSSTILTTTFPQATQTDRALSPAVLTPHSKGNTQHMPQHLSPCHRVAPASRITERVRGTTAPRIDVAV